MSQELNGDLVTMVNHETGMIVVGLGARRYLDEEDGWEWGFTVNEQDEHATPESELLEITATSGRFRNGKGQLVEFRPTIPTDPEAAQNHPYFPAYPLPVEITGGIMHGTLTKPRLFGAIGSSDVVHTLVLWTDSGIYARYGRAWHRTNAKALSGLRVVEIDDMDVETYDQTDERGDAMTGLSLTTLDGNRAAPASPIFAAAPVTASVPVTSPVVASLDDVGPAIEWATDNESSRWYIEKRARALGYTEQFPWSE